MGKFEMHRYLREFLEEISRYKWIESEKCGYDIGEETAVRGWLCRHYDAWFQNRFQGKKEAP